MLVTQWVVLVTLFSQFINYLFFVGFWLFFIGRFAKIIKISIMTRFETIIIQSCAAVTMMIDIFSFAIFVYFRWTRCFHSDNLYTSTSKSHHNSTYKIFADIFLTVPAYVLAYCIYYNVYPCSTNNGGKFFSIFSLTISHQHICRFFSNRSMEWTLNLCQVWFLDFVLFYSLPPISLL